MNHEFDAPCLLSYFTSADDEYIVLVSPGNSPLDFCRAGYSLAGTLEIWNAFDLPFDVILRVEHEDTEADTEPDEGPLTEQFENSSRLHDDDWLEYRIEDDISGWEG